ncbi:alpha,alpha-phosphotrehalase [Gilliamella sp. wkB308]|uniref:alpha,alpha-phosphotrehalase n=1 Tax=Gilliamella sp. wkB308 TaxID=3120263 RepID=UPI00080D9A7B|nr:alpha,alpha-phosphotrehalase [Gilliamella apicola]OCF94710.1 alpha,alpha-phosphotrehalase [Gilliamella apicola]OCF96709.1 alpha,alpha-phosphotrehalase [Gilliamella apicola]OCF98210.1 alpha,alpha-phosphotrehalase [Gilliamella apicola]OCF99913.1 alpha,alpha-phosphotrehalase [Gilliamella apicola]
MNTNEIPWWQNGTIYQIYPKSFQASGTGSTGDLLGIISRLDYLKNLGISAIWLTPIYPSPQVDNGYDVSDYYDIDPAYGTMDDFELLVKQAHERDIRIMMDMVFNHTSTEHPWFKSALDKTSPFRSFYIWKDAKADGSEPNNWRSKFGGNAWQWHEQSGQYYLHLFAKQQADLNWENPTVRQEIKNVCQFWADKGVDALRLDVINLVSKQQDFPDDVQGDGRKYYTDGPKIHEFLQEISRDVFLPNGLKTVGEMSSTTLENCQKYAALDGKELTMTFNFHHLKIDYPNGEKWTLAKPDLLELKKILGYWQKGMHGKAWNAIFWCNHDQPRIVSRLGNEDQYHSESAKMLAMILYGLQGTPYLYQGEEIGMTNPHFTHISQYKDVESLNIYQEKIAEGMSESDMLAILASKSRDNSRTPMQWDHTANAGFSQGKPWIEVANNYSKINVKAALDDPNSIFYCYQTLIKLRKMYPIFIFGDYQDLTPDVANCWCYARHWNNQTLLVIANLTENTVKWQLPNGFENRHWQRLLGNYENQTILKPEMVLQPYEAMYWLHINS